ncbi:CheR family methyltransferase [Paenibacillus whitsoniae]|uniref:CheR family methyltransferase n=1 Tax=Paenibacillus whitsoniae TaxID=2496558 RepID=UPI003B96F569
MNLWEIYPPEQEKLPYQDELQNIEINLLLEGIYQICGFDFRHYVRSSLQRRILHRMKLEKLPSITALLEKVLHEPGFMDVLLNDMSIRVTEMFRDPSFFAAFRCQVVPHLKALPEIRIWHAGCATGEEVYAMAILMKEEGLLERTRIYATDMNRKAIKIAQQGAYPLKQIQTYTRNYLEAGGKMAFSDYYTADSRNAYFGEGLRDKLMFAQHNLVTDGSFNEFHVIICRNVLIYFDLHLQKQVHRLFHGSLTPQGFLGLGTKETIHAVSAAVCYREFAPKERIYRKV